MTVIERMNNLNEARAKLRPQVTIYDLLGAYCDVVKRNTNGKFFLEKKPRERKEKGSR